MGTSSFPSPPETLASFLKFAGGTVAVVGGLALTVELGPTACLSCMANPKYCEYLMTNTADLIDAIVSKGPCGPAYGGYVGLSYAFVVNTEDYKGRSKE